MTDELLARLVGVLERIESKLDALPTREPKTKARARPLRKLSDEQIAKKVEHALLRAGALPKKR